MCAFWWIYHQQTGAIGNFKIGTDIIDQKYSKWHKNTTNWVTRMNAAMLSFGFTLDSRTDNIAPGLIRSVSNNIHSTDAPYTMICIGEPDGFGHYLAVYKTPSSKMFSDYDYKMFDPNIGTYSCNKKSELHSWVSDMHNTYSERLKAHDVEEMKWHVANFNDAGTRQSRIVRVRGH